MFHKTLVLCQNDGCVKKGPMSYEKLIEHSETCPPKIAMCTLGCGEQITNFDD